MLGLLKGAVALLACTAGFAAAQCSCVQGCQVDACFRKLTGEGFFAEQITVDDCRSYLRTTVTPATYTLYELHVSVIRAQAQTTETITERTTLTHTSTASTTSTETITVPAGAKKVRKRQGGQSQIPDYATDVCDEAAYTRACTCLGYQISLSTVEGPRPTTTVTQYSFSTQTDWVTIPDGTTTLTVTATDTTTVEFTATTTVTA